MSIKSLTAEIQKVKASINKKIAKIKNLRKSNTLAVTDPITGTKRDANLGDVNSVDVALAIDEFKTLRDKYKELLKAVKDAELVSVRWVGEPPQPTGGGAKTLWRLGYSKSIPGAPNIWHCVIEKIDVDVDHGDPTQTKFTRKQHFYLDQGLNLPVTEDFIPHFAWDSHLTVWFHRRVTNVVPNINELYVWTYEDPGGDVGGDFPVPSAANMTITNLMNGLTQDTAEIGTTVLKPFTPNVVQTTIDTFGTTITWNWEYLATPSGEQLTVTTTRAGDPPSSIVLAESTVTVGNDVVPTTSAYLNVDPLAYFLKSNSYDSIYSTTAAIGSGVYLNWDIILRSDVQSEHLIIDEIGYHASGNNDNGDSYTYDYSWGDDVAVWTGQWHSITNFTAIVNEVIASQLHVLPYPVGATPSRTLSGHEFTLPSSLTSPGVSVQYFCSFAPIKYGDFTQLPPGWHLEMGYFDEWDWPIGGNGAIGKGPTAFFRVANQIGHATEDTFSTTYSGVDSVYKTTTVSMSAAFSRTVLQASEARSPVVLVPNLSVIQVATQGQTIGGGHPDGLFMWDESPLMPGGHIVLKNEQDFTALTGSCQNSASAYNTAIQGSATPSTARDILTRGIDGAVLQDPFGEVWAASHTMFFDRMIVLAKYLPTDTTMTAIRSSQVILQHDAITDENDVPIPIASSPLPQKIFQDRASGLFTETTDLSKVATAPSIGLVLDGLSSGTVKLKRDKEASLPEELGSIVFPFRWFADLSDNS